MSLVHDKLLQKTKLLYLKALLQDCNTSWRKDNQNEKKNDDSSGKVEIAESTARKRSHSSCSAPKL
jgi:hypothetical protein